MSTVATVGIPADEFALRETLEEFPTIDCEIVRVAAHRESRMMSLVWIKTNENDPARIHEALEADKSVDSVVLLNDLRDERLYRFDWVEDIQAITHLMLDERATILNAYTTDDEWTFRVLFPGRESLSRSVGFCEEAGLTVTIKSIYELTEERKGIYGLSNEQQEALLVAYRRGYFNVPRGISMENLADDLDISQQALSERIRRGHTNLIGNTLAIASFEEARTQSDAE